MVSPVLADISPELGVVPGHFGTMFLDDVFVELDSFLPNRRLHLKLEGFNFAGSIKIKTALSLVSALEESGRLFAGKKVIESSSGNLGVALAVVCLSRGYPFVCVVDPNSAPSNIKLIKAYSGRVLMCDRPDSNGGYLESRIQLIQKVLRDDLSYVWPNQYANEANSEAHRRWTGPAILRRVPDVDFVFIGAGTTGTLMGCARFFREQAPHVKVIAIEPQGSVTFGYPPGKRYIPGIGTSRRPELCDPSLVHGVVIVPERETIAMCRRMRLQQGALLGGSTGSVLAGIVQHVRFIPEGSVVVAIAPDLGERYLDSIYDDDWVRHHFPGSDFTF